MLLDSFYSDVGTKNLYIKIVSGKKCETEIKCCHIRDGAWVLNPSELNRALSTSPKLAIL